MTFVGESFWISTNDVLLGSMHVAMHPLISSSLIFSSCCCTMLIVLTPPSPLGLEGVTC